MASSYLKYLETSPAPNPTPSALARLADALGVSTSTLAGARAGEVGQPGAPGPAHGSRVADPGAGSDHAVRAGNSPLSRPRAMGRGDKDTYLRITVTDITGRRIRAST
jgi:hypothetical protein